MESKSRGGATAHPSRVPRHSPHVVIRRLAMLGLVAGLGGTFLLDRFVGTDTAYRFALGFGVAFVITWGVKAWEHRS